MKVFYTSRALMDLERIVDFLVAEDAVLAHEALHVIADAVAVLERHPFIGRVVRRNLRELVISRGRSGYVALYRVSIKDDRVEILTVRHPREAGFS